MASHQLFSTAWAVLGGEDEAIEECVHCAKAQLREASALCMVSNAVLGSICRGLKPPSRDFVGGSTGEPRRSSKAGVTRPRSAIADSMQIASYCHYGHSTGDWDGFGRVLRLNLSKSRPKIVLYSGKPW